MEKIEVTIKDILKLEGINNSELAKKVGLSIGAISRISNNNGNITQYVRDKFKQVYPQYDLKNGMNSWKMKYNELVDEYNQLLSDYNEMKNELEGFKNGVERFNTYLNKYNNSKKHKRR